MPSTPPRCRGLTGILFSLAIVASATLSPTRAQAYEDRLSLDLGASCFVAPEVRPGVVVGGSLGLSDAFTLRAAIAYDFRVQSPVTHTLRGHADLLYLVDIVEWVPFFGLRAGGELSVYPSRAGSPFGGLVGGLDHFVSRDAIVGIDIAWTFASYDGAIEQRLNIALRLTLLYDS